MWKIKQFKTQAELSRWVQRNYGKYQFVDVFLNNAVFESPEVIV